MATKRVAHVVAGTGGATFTIEVAAIDDAIVIVVPTYGVVEHQGIARMWTFVRRLIGGVFAVAVLRKDKSEVLEIYDEHNTNQPKHDGRGLHTTQMEKLTNIGHGYNPGIHRGTPR